MILNVSSIISINFMYQLYLLFLLITKLFCETEIEAASYARYLVHKEIKGVFAGQYSQNTKYAFASYEDFAESYLQNGQPIFLLANISTTSRNLIYNSYGSFSIFMPNCSINNYDHMSYDPMACYRITLLGYFNRLSNIDIINSQINVFIKKHPATIDWIKYSNHTFNLWILEIEEIYYIGGYGNLHYIGNIDLELYFNAKPINPPS